MKPVYYLMVCPSLIVIMSFGVLARYLIGDALPDVSTLLTTATAVAAVQRESPTVAANTTANTGTDNANANAERQRAKEREERRENERRERDKERQATRQAAAPPTGGDDGELPDDLPPVPVPDRDRTAFVPPYGRGRVQPARPAT